MCQCAGVSVCDVLEVTVVRQLCVGPPCIGWAGPMAVGIHWTDSHGQEGLSLTQLHSVLDQAGIRLRPGIVVPMLLLHACASPYRCRTTWLVLAAAQHTAVLHKSVQCSTALAGWVGGPASVITVLH